MIQEQVPMQRPSHCLAIVVLLIILVFAVLYAIAQFGASFGGSGYSFEQEEAYQLAQETQNWRRYHPTGSNYGLASITIFYQDGSSRRFVRETHGIFFPFKSDPARQIHSEEFAHDWILEELDILRNSRYIDAQTTSITIIIFSQVDVCGPCQKKMRSWQKEFRQAAGTQALTLSIWDLTHGYNPAKSPKGSPVASEDDVVEVPITFT
jgi:hypothetical protein